MIVLHGKKTIDISANDFKARIAGFSSLCIDVGTGAGTFIYKRARENPDVFYMGIDAACDNMVACAIKSLKKPEKGGLKNILFVVSAIEQAPEMLRGVADEIYVNLPWGSLLEGVVKGMEQVMSKIASMAKPAAKLFVTTTYSVLHEEGEIIKRELPSLSVQYFEAELKQVYAQFGIRLDTITTLGCEDLKFYASQWAKKLAFGKQREIFKISCTVEKG